MSSEDWGNNDQYNDYPVPIFSVSLVFLTLSFSTSSLTASHTKFSITVIRTFGLCLIQLVHLGFEWFEFGTFLDVHHAPFILVQKVHKARGVWWTDNKGPHLGYPVFVFIIVVRMSALTNYLHLHHLIYILQFYLFIHLHVYSTTTHS